MKPIDTYMPTERDILVSLTDALMALSEKLFPDEKMLVTVKASDPNVRWIGVLNGTTLTEWVPR